MSSYLLLSLNTSVRFLPPCWCLCQWCSFYCHATFLLSLYEYTILYLSLFLLMDIWIVSSFRLLNIKLL